MYSKIISAIAAIAFGGAFTYFGYLLFVGTPATSGTRRGQTFMSIQNFLIDNLGMTTSGILLMAIGLLGGAYGLFSAFTSSDDE